LRTASVYRGTEKESIHTVKLDNYHSLKGDFPERFFRHLGKKYRGAESHPGDEKGGWVGVESILALGRRGKVYGLEKAVAK